MLDQVWMDNIIHVTKFVPSMSPMTETWGGGGVLA